MPDAESIYVGVPQGSILGPLLFVLLVSDLPTVVHKCSMLMYADDTVLFYSGKVAIEERLNENLDLTGSWFHNNFFVQWLSFVSEEDCIVCDHLWILRWL